MSSLVAAMHSDRNRMPCAPLHTAMTPVLAALTLAPRPAFLLTDAPSPAASLKEGCRAPLAPGQPTAGGFFLDFFSHRSLDQPQTFQRNVGWMRSLQFVGQADCTLDNVRPHPRPKPRLGVIYLEP
jgi:hypothetical protein